MSLPPHALAIIDELIATAPPLSPEQQLVIQQVFTPARTPAAPAA